MVLVTVLSSNHAKPYSCLPLCLPDNAPRLERSSLGSTSLTGSLFCSQAFSYRVSIQQGSVARLILWLTTRAQEGNINILLLWHHHCGGRVGGWRDQKQDWHITIGTKTHCPPGLRTTDPGGARKTHHREIRKQMICEWSCVSLPVQQFGFEWPLFPCPLTCIHPREVYLLFSKSSLFLTTSSHVHGTIPYQDTRIGKLWYLTSGLRPVLLTSPSLPSI